MTAEPRDVEEIRADLDALAEPSESRLHVQAKQHAAKLRLLRDVEPLLDRLAAADRENAELRGEVERHEVFMRAIKDCRDDPARAIAQNDIINGKAIIAAHIAEAERDDLRAQLAAAQAQLAKHRDAMVAHMHRADAADARLEAVRALAAEWIARGTVSVYESAAELGEIVAAALSAAPQPEPEVVGETLRVYRERARGQAVSDYDRISAEMRRVGYDKLSDADRAWVDDYRAARPDPWVTPASDEPARCDCFGAECVTCLVSRGRRVLCRRTLSSGSRGVVYYTNCPGPDASGTPDGGL